jgi:hypothetical protein
MLIQYFHSVEELYTSLGFTTIPSPSVKYEKSDNSALVASLESSVSSEVLQNALSKLQEMLSYYKVSKKPLPLLLSLYSVGYENIKLYKKIIQLDQDIPSLSSTPLSSGSLGGGTEQPLYSLSSLQSIDDLKYRGEKKLSEVVDNFESFSTSFANPLKYLRQSYSKLDRS